jgi:hypothetical protein
MKAERRVWYLVCLCLGPPGWIAGVAIWFANRNDDRKARAAGAPPRVETFERAVKLFAYQDERFETGVEELADELQTILRWPDAREVDLGLELERLEAGQTVEEFCATPRRAPELPPP